MSRPEILRPGFGDRAGAANSPRAAIARSQALQAQMEAAGREAALAWLAALREVAAEGAELVSLPGVDLDLKERARTLVADIDRQLAAIDRSVGR